MNSPRKTLLCLCLAAGCLLALGHSSQALADPVDFSFRQGPSTMVIPVNDYRQFHSHLTNTGDNDDSLHPRRHGAGPRELDLQRVLRRCLLIPRARRTRCP